MVNDNSDKKIDQLEVSKSFHQELNGANRLYMFNLSKSLVVRASNWQLPSGAGLKRSQVQSTMNNPSTIRKSNQNTCHKRLSSGSVHNQSSSVNSMKRLEGKVAVVTASTDG